MLQKVERGIAEGPGVLLRGKRGSRKEIWSAAKREEEVGESQELMGACMSSMGTAKRSARGKRVWEL